MINEDKYDWRTQDDARIMKQYQELKSDPERFNKAKECIADQVRAGKAVLQDKPIGAPCRKKNPACIGKLPIKY